MIQLLLDKGAKEQVETVQWVQYHPGETAYVAIQTFTPGISSPLRDAQLQSMQPVSLMGNTAQEDLAHAQKIKHR